MNSASKIKYPLSFSVLNLYKQCPRKYKYAKIDRIDPGYRDMTALLKGSAIHSILENYPNPGTHKLSNKYRHIVDNFVKSEIAKQYLTSDSVRELKFGIDSNLKDVGYSSPDAILRGIIDHLCIKDELLTVVDWKTGKYQDEKYQDFNQLLLYGVFLFNKYSIDKIKISYVYVEHSLENSIILERKYLENYEKTILEMIENLKNDDEFLKNPSRLCNFCEFKNHCSNDNV